MTFPNHPLFRTISTCWSLENFPRLVDLPLRMPLHTDLLSLIPRPYFTIPQALNVFQPAVLPLSTPAVLCNPPFLTIHQCLPRTQSRLLISVTKPQSSPAYLSLPPPLYSGQTEVSLPKLFPQPGMPLKPPGLLGKLLILPERAGMCSPCAVYSGHSLTALVLSSKGLCWVNSPLSSLRSGSEASLRP